MFCGHITSRSKADYVIDHETGCWEWQKHKLRGYGIAGAHGRAHRLYYQRAYGLVPKGQHLHHKCHNPGCVNPEHLELVDNREHLRRHRQAASNLTIEQVRAIKMSPLPGKEAAEKYGATIHIVWDIRRGSSWGSVEVDLPPRVCHFCGAELIGGYRNRRYCDKKCQYEFNKASRKAAA